MMKKAFGKSRYDYADFCDWIRKLILKLYLMTLSLKKFVSGLQKPQSV
jgi:hypothetical protein